MKRENEIDVDSDVNDVSYERKICNVDDDTILGGCLEREEHEEGEEFELVEPMVFDLVMFSHLENIFFKVAIQIFSLL